MIVCIAVLIISVVGTTYAFYRIFFDEFSIDTMTYGLDYYIEYKEGQDIVSGVLNESADYTGGQKADVEFWKKDDTYDIYGHIYLDIVRIGENLSMSNALKYALVSDGIVISEGDLENSYSGQTILLKGNIPLSLEKTLYTVYIWLDENNIDETFIGETISATVRCEATMEDILGNAAEYITNLYNTSDKFPVINNEVTYNYAPSVSLMNDRLGSMSTLIDGGNIRYYGSNNNVNNYVYFNCSDYTNQNNSKCEKWRIIGVFDGKLKLIKNNYLEQYSWDYKPNTSSAISNNWTNASLNSLLNDTYYYSGTTSYYNASTTPITIDFTGLGIKEKSRNLISNSDWYLGKTAAVDVYPDSIYSMERNGQIYNGKMALLYASDYGYAADFNICQNKTLNAYNDSTLCIPYNWLGTSLTTGVVWLLNPVEGKSWMSFALNNRALIQYSASNKFYIYPTLHLDSKVIFASGDGTNANPYKLLVK